MNYAKGGYRKGGKENTAERKMGKRNNKSWKWKWWRGKAIKVGEGLAMSETKEAETVRN